MSWKIPDVRRLAVPAVCCLIAFLAYSSQYLFHQIEPGPLTTKEAIWFNLFVLCLWFCYERSVNVDPGRLPKGIAEAARPENKEIAQLRGRRQRSINWCKKCNAVKPPRAHHCSRCKRCIPKMDHHCPWTANCVSARTFPHFLRFLFYAVLSMTILECHLWARCMVIWEKRSQPSYLGPSVYQLVHLLDLFVVNSLTLFALFVLLVSHCHSLLINQTMIEDWEIERHETLVWRAKKNGGYVYGPGGRKVWVRKQEFPFDIGFWNNAVQGMGTANLLAWFIPFAPSPSRESGWEYETNGFEIPGTSWPPPDPDRMPRNMSPSRRHRGTFSDHPNRQRRDQRRRVGLDGSDSPAEVPDEYDWLEGDDEDDNGHGYDEEVREEDDYKNVYDYDYVGDNGIDENSGGWMNSQGDRLRDYGVDEEAEVLTDEDDIPLGELIRRRKAKAQAAIETAATTVAE